jgi:hypothetical protein
MNLKTHMRAIVVLLVALTLLLLGLFARNTDHGSMLPTVGELEGRSPSATDEAAPVAAGGSDRTLLSVPMPVDPVAASASTPSEEKATASAIDYEADRAAYFRDNLTKYILRLQKESTLGNCHMLMGFVIGANIEMSGIGAVIKRDSNKLDLKQLQAGGDQLIQVNDRLYTFSPNLFPEYSELCAALGVNGTDAQHKGVGAGAREESELISRIVDRATVALNLVK